MATITLQRDIVVNLKKETFLNVNMLSKVHPMPIELSMQICKEDALEKPTQYLFNHLSYYLVKIINPQKSAALSWPLYDTKTERTYRNELSSFISEYSSKGLLSPVMPSYLVNPGCYKVTNLIFQLSHLAIDRVLKSKMKKEQKVLYNEMTEKFKSQNKEGFMDRIEQETNRMLSKFSNYLVKRQTMEKIAWMFRKKITEMETILTDSNAQNYINNLVDGYIKENTLDEETKNIILNIKKVNVPSQFFDDWLKETDEQIDRMEKEWNEKMSPFLQTCQETIVHTEALMARHTGKIDKSLFMVEFDPKTDMLFTNDLQNQVNSEQKYILRNIIKDDILNFPNLIRSFVISICFILKNMEIDDDIYKFNQYLNDGCNNFNEIVSAMKTLLERVLNVEAKFQSTQMTFHQAISLKELSEISPCPDLTDIKIGKNYHSQVLFDTFTPLNVYKHKFNLRRQSNINSSMRPSLKSLFITPFHEGPRDDILKSLISCRTSCYNRPNTNQMHDISMMSQTINKVNETIAECSSGFTKQQILRLMSTKKSSSSKKFKNKTQRPEAHIKKGNLFNESILSNESTVLFRSHSSPNLFENRERKYFSKSRSRKLSIMKEDSPSLLEVSGITALERDSGISGTPQRIINLDNAKKLDTTSLPVITFNLESEKKISDILKEIEVDLNEIQVEETETQIVLKERKSIEITDNKETMNETPKLSVQPIKKTSSIEKIISRFKKVRASIVPMEKKDEDIMEIKTIVEEKENNFNDVNLDVFTANKVLLPDLLSPSCSTLSMKSNDYLDLSSENDEKVCRKQRESLGTVLGVDKTFLDQFDLID